MNDAQKEAITTVALLLAQYYQSLVDQGIDKEMAFRFAVQFQKDIIDKTTNVGLDGAGTHLQLS